MTKKVKVLCSQTVYYTYFLNVPDNYDVEEYVYATLRNCDENPSSIDDPVEIYDYDEIIVDDIREF